MLQIRFIHISPFSANWSCNLPTDELLWEIKSVLATVFRGYILLTGPTYVLICSTQQHKSQSPHTAEGEWGVLKLAEQSYQETSGSSHTAEWVMLIQVTINAKAGVANIHAWLQHLILPLHLTKEQRLTKKIRINTAYGGSKRVLTAQVKLLT